MSKPVAARNYFRPATGSSRVVHTRSLLNRKRLAELFTRRGSLLRFCLLRSVHGRLAFEIGVDPDFYFSLQILREGDRHIIFIDPIELARQRDVVGLNVEALGLELLGDIGGAD